MSVFFVDNQGGEPSSPSAPPVRRPSVPCGAGGPPKTLSIATPSAPPGPRPRRILGAQTGCSDSRKAVRGSAAPSVQSAAGEGARGEAPRATGVRGDGSHPVRAGAGGADGAEPRPHGAARPHPGARCDTEGLGAKNLPPGFGAAGSVSGRLGGASGAEAAAGNDLGRPPHPQSPLQTVSLTPGPFTSPGPWLTQHRALPPLCSAPRARARGDGADVAAAAEGAAAGAAGEPAVEPGRPAAAPRARGARRRPDLEAPARRAPAEPAGGGQAGADVLGEGAGGPGPAAPAGGPGAPAGAAGLPRDLHRRAQGAPPRRGRGAGGAPPD